jgi:signal transduction histidine kinase/CheY-like chemotaxis protein/HPt (histidine-containing phosphotransfer) domain-containing protein
MTPDRLALDLQRALNELGQEKARTLQLLSEVERQNREIDRLRSSVHRESNSRLLAEEALDETRDRLQMAVDAAGLALWDWQLPAQQMFLTARWGELIGDIGRDAYWELADLKARLHPEDAHLLEAAMSHLLQGREQRAMVQHRVRTATGWMWVETHGMVAEHDAKGKPIRLMGTLADIGERKRIEQDSAKARELAEQASRAKSDFLANISHEVRTPLNALMGLTRMLMESPLNAEQASWLSLMDSSAQSLLGLLNDILDLSRIEAGKLEIEHTRFDLHRALSDAVGPHAEQARAKPLHFQLVLHPDLPQWVAGDPGRLGQLIGNLLSNAIKFTPRNGRINVSATCASTAEQPAGHLKVKVQDNGVGIARKQQATIFDSFTQADASTARRHGGSGLGLAICARLAGLMGGTIELQSELGQGSTFTLTLPLQEAPAASAEHSSAAKELTQIAEAGQRFAGMVVLLAEDNPVNELMLRQLLLRLGCIVRVARGGAQAVAQWEQGGIDMVLMDVQMPGMSGLQATQMIREAENKRRLRRTPIVAVTANAMPGDRQACLAAGMDGYTPKPVSPQALMQEMDRVLAALAPGQLPAVPAPDAPPPAGVATRHVASPEALDVNKLRRRLDGDEDTLRQLALAMRGDLMSRLADMQRALEAKDTAAAVAHAHGLKGSLGSMTAERGARLAKGLELAARADDWSLFGRALPLMRAEARQIDRILARILDAGGSDLFGSTEPPVTVY